MVLRAALSFTHNHWHFAWSDDAYRLEISQGCWAGSNELSNSHTFIFESLAHSSQAAARDPPQAALIILLLLPIPPSVTKTCHHFPANVVLMIGDCCCVIWRSLRPCTDGAAPALCLWIWRRGREQGRGRRKRKGGGGGGGESPGADSQQASSSLLFFCTSIFTFEH